MLPTPGCADTAIPSQHTSMQRASTEAVPVAAAIAKGRAALTKTRKKVEVNFIMLWGLDRNVVDFL